MRKSKLVARDISESLGKLPPQALDLEEAILGAIMLSKKDLKVIIDLLKPNHFYADPHREIYEAICQLHEASKPTDMRMVVTQLRKNGKIELVGGAYKIAELTSKVSSDANIQHHAGVIIEHSIKRDLIKIASHIHHEAYEDTTDCFALLEDSYDKIRDIKKSSSNRPIVDISEIYLAPNLDEMGTEYDKGIKSAETTFILSVDKMFKWFPGSLNCWTGWENQGKSTLNYFIRLVKSKHDGSKWTIVSPEQLLSVNGTKSATAIYNNLIHALTGKNPYLHLGNQMPRDEYMEALEFVKKHFFILHVKDKHYKSIIEGCRAFYYEYGTYGFLIDPWKNLRGVDHFGFTKDQSLEYCFDDFRDMIDETNQVGDIIAHPKSMKDREMRVGGPKSPYRVVSQYDLLGGSAWANSMDGIYSYHRPYIHENKDSPFGDLYNLRQRHQHLVTKRGVCENIYFDFDRNRFYFNDRCPLDDSHRNPALDSQSNLGFAPSWKKKETVDVNSDDLPF